MLLPLIFLFVHPRSLTIQSTVRKAMMTNSNTCLPLESSLYPVLAHIDITLSPFSHKQISPFAVAMGFQVPKLSPETSALGLLPSEKSGKDETSAKDLTIPQGPWPALIHMPTFRPTNTLLVIEVGSGWTFEVFSGTGTVDVSNPAMWMSPPARLEILASLSVKTAW